MFQTCGANIQNHQEVCVDLIETEPREPDSKFK